MTNIYINGLGNVSPQETTDSRHFLERPLSFYSNRLKCIDPGYKEFIPAEQSRRMGRIIKMGISAAKLCLQDTAAGSDESCTKEINPDAIITGTGLGCMEDTEKFLTSMIRDKEEFLTPTAFIQSTHNTVSGQIALLLHCHNYNFTYVHRGISFESALMDSMTQLHSGECSNVLTGGFDENTDNSFAITSRLGYWKRKPIDTFSLFKDSGRGSICGEGASFFFLENQKNDQTYAELLGVETFQKPASGAEINSRLHQFLEKHQQNSGDIDLLLLGMNGDPGTDKVYHDLVNTGFPVTPVACFKHLCGEYHTASAFAMWLASMVLKTQMTPEIIRYHMNPPQIERVLIYNHFQNNDHAFILLNRC